MTKELHKCPCDPACMCVMDKPCLGCETYAKWLEKTTRRPSPMEIHLFNEQQRRK